MGSVRVLARAPKDGSSAPSGSGRNRSTRAPGALTENRHREDDRTIMTSRKSPIVDAARHWVKHFYPYNRAHLLQSLVWLERIAPDAREAVRIATVTHDMERAFPGPDQPVSVRLNDPAYDAAHAERSARIVGRWLREQGVPLDLITRCRGAHCRPRGRRLARRRSRSSGR